MRTCAGLRPPGLNPRRRPRRVELQLNEGSHLRLFAEEREKLMRSDLIFGALTHVNNRYQLCQLASKATRKLHKPNTRLQDTTNEVLDRFKDSMPMDVVREEPVETVASVRRAA